MTELEKSIIATLGYFEIFNYPLDAKQIHKNLIDARADFDEVDLALKEMLNEGKIISKNNSYALPRREYLFPLKEKSLKLSIRKIKILKLAKLVLSLIPWVRGAILFGSLSIKNANELSDIDLMIIAKKGHVWTTRLFVKIILTALLIGRKKNQEHAPNKICPNHFVSEDCLEIPFQNIYNAMMYRNGVVVIDKGLNLRSEFFKKNPWIFKSDINSTYKENFKKDIGHLSLLERLSKFIQVKIMTREAMDKANSSQTRICDDYLAFHDLDRESEIIHKVFHKLKLNN